MSGTRISSDQLIGWASYAVMPKVWEELKRANELHPDYPSDHLRRTAIMVEEAGEAIRAALDLTRDTTSGPDRSTKWYAEARANLRAELMQTAAMAIRQLVAMEQDAEGAVKQGAEEQEERQ